MNSKARCLTGFGAAVSLLMLGCGSSSSRVPSDAGRDLPTAVTGGKGYTGSGGGTAGVPGGGGGLGAGGTPGAGGATGGVGGAAAGAGGATGGVGGAAAGAGGAIGGGAGSARGGTSGGVATFMCGSTTCAVGVHYCYSYIGGVIGSTTSYACSSLPPSCSSGTLCGCVCPPSTNPVIGCQGPSTVSGAYCSCRESNGIASVSCAGS